jgi:hypothetical protein
VNVELAEKVIAQILMEPERLDMTEWIGRYDPEWGDVCRADGTLARLQADCGTRACIAGWVLMLAMPYARIHGDLIEITGLTYSTESVAARALGLGLSVASYLFHQVGDDEAVMALKYLIGNPDATASDLAEFLKAARRDGI